MNYTEGVWYVTCKWRLVVVISSLLALLPITHWSHSTVPWPGVMLLPCIRHTVSSVQVQCPHCVWCPGAAITGLHIGNISRWSQTRSGIPGTRHCGYIIWKGWTGPTAEIFMEYPEIPTQSYIDLVGVVAVANCLKVNQEQQSPIKRTTLHGASCHCLFWADIEVPSHCSSFPCRVPVRHPAARLERVGHHTTNIQGE